MNINSDRVKTLRAAKQWSQEQLADACGLNLRTIQRLENTGKASIESLRALAAVFEVDANELTLAGPDEADTALGAIRSGFIKFAEFSGTASRFEYWWFCLLVMLIAAIATVIHEKAYQIAMLALLVPFLAVGTRRLNDAGRSPWWQLMFLVPFGFVVVGYLCTLKSKDPSDPAGSENLDPA
jgi:transcriptional regulator with XRE-family HTH domain